jgi:hypothetical protein
MKLKNDDITWVEEAVFLSIVLMVMILIIIFI